MMAWKTNEIGILTLVKVTR